MSDERCGKPCVRDLTDGTCKRDKGHRGKHRDWRHPDCSACGEEMRCVGYRYTCNHPSWNGPDRWDRIDEAYRRVFGAEDGAA